MPDATPEASRIRFRKLRIAWSVTWGVVAVLLVVLWVQSNHGEDLIFRTDFTDFVSRDNKLHYLGFLVKPPAMQRSPLFDLWVPYWLLVGTAAVVAAAPWLPWSNASLSNYCSLSRRWRSWR
jgi:hypothetical protein